MGFFERMKSLGKRIVETGRRIVTAGRKAVYDITSRVTGGRQTNRSSAANKLPASKPLDYKPISKPLEMEVFNRRTGGAKDFEFKAESRVREYKGTKSDSYFGRGETGIEKRISKATSDKEGVLTDITSEQAQIFWQATRRAWEGKDPRKRYDYIREYFGTDSIQEIFDYVMDRNVEALAHVGDKVSSDDSVLEQGIVLYKPSERFLDFVTSINNAYNEAGERMTKEDFDRWVSYHYRKREPFVGEDTINKNKQWWQEHY